MVGEGLNSLLLALKMEGKGHQWWNEGGLLKFKDMDSALESPGEMQSCRYPF